MRNVVLFIATSLDGFIGRPDGAIDWLFSDADYNYTRFLAGVDTVVMGRRTYELTLTFGDYPYPEKTGYVFSRAAQAPQPHLQFVDSDPGDFVAQLRSKPGRDIWVVGGSEIVQACLRKNVIDEFIISIHPVLLGQGIPLFVPGCAEIPLHLIESQSFDSGLVQVTYRRPLLEHFP